MFHCIAYDYYHADWNVLRDHLRDVPWEDIFKGCVYYTYQTRKSVFYSTSKALFVLEKIKF